MTTRSQQGLILMLLGALICPVVKGSDSPRPKREGRQVVELQTLSWVFNARQSPASAINAQVARAQFAGPADQTNSFTIQLTADLKAFDRRREILEIPGVVSVCLRQHNARDRQRQNYPAFKMPDGSVPVLEATVVLHSLEHPDWQNMTIGIPLAMLGKPVGKHEIVLNFTGATWTMYVDGELLDNDFPFGYPHWTEQNSWKLDAEIVKSAAIHFPAIKPEARPAKTPDTAPGIQYWMPRGHNNWVGDVETCFYQGRYHVFYLYDRRHHQSKFGCGAHYFEHLSTTDFKTWIEHEAATPLEEQWECIGTGVPFIYQNQLCLSYGLHSTRVYPEARTTLPAQWEYLKKNGISGSFKRAATPGVPAGATYSVSTDGVSHFRKSNLMFHPCQNPSVYVDPDGKLRMLANFGSKGMWESDSLEGGWRCLSPDFPPGGDCTIFFRWGRFDYIMGGFSGLWSKSADAPISAYEDLAARGLDFYDGSNVPAVTEIADGRFLMAAWIPIRGWGGSLVIRELIQFPDGRIGSKWMNEITPPVDTRIKLAAEVAGTAIFPTDSKSFLLAFTAYPESAGKGKVGIAFLPENGDQAGREWQLCLDDLRAQFGPGSTDHFAVRQKSLREGGSPQGAENYAIEGLIGVNNPFTVRVVVKNSDKIGGSLIDAEIAGRRTMISHCPELLVKRMVFRMEGVKIKDLQIGRQ